MAAAKKKEPSFEEYMSRLEALTEEMEKSDLPLEKLMRLHEEGMEIASKLRQKLDGAAARIMEVRQNADGKPIAVESDGAEQLGFLEESGE